MELSVFRPSATGNTSNDVMLRYVGEWVMGVYGGESM